MKLIPMPWHARNEYEEFSLCSNMGELFPSVLDVYLPVGMLLEILFSRICNNKILW